MVAAAFWLAVFSTGGWPFIIAPVRPWTIALFKSGIADISAGAVGLLPPLETSVQTGLPGAEKSSTISCGLLFSTGAG